MLSMDLILSGLLYSNVDKYGDGMWYVFPDGAEGSTYAFRAIASYFVLLN